MVKIYQYITIKKTYDIDGVFLKSVPKKVFKCDILTEDVEQTRIKLAKKHRCDFVEVAVSENVTKQEIIKYHWDKVERGYYERNSTFFDENGWLRGLLLKPKAKAKRLLTIRDEGFMYYRPKSLDGLFENENV